MAYDNWRHCLEMILHHEGGYVDHPDDPGGETNLGVTKKVYEDWGGTKDMKDLTVEDVEPIYLENYWNRVKGDDLPSGLDLCVFDFGVNAGTGRAAKYLQGMVGATQDGAIGPMTIEAVNKYCDEHGVDQAIGEYQHKRQGYYEGLRHFATFGRGWTRRVTETTEEALNMA
jgi:lysozyme family protein